MKLFASLLLSSLLFSGLTGRAQQNLPQLGKAPVKDVIKAMTLEEKVSLVIGGSANKRTPAENTPNSVTANTIKTVPGVAGTTVAIPRLGIPSIFLADGPAGLRIQPFRNSDSTVSYFCTGFPIETLLASTWNQETVKKVGSAMGNEVKEYGVDVLLAPALNNHRNPLGGRNFEYYSEDPLVTGRMASAMVNGVQSQGVGTSIKHFAANNHEWNRTTINIIAGARPLREIYLRGFEIAVKQSNPWTVMSSYNKVNGTYTSERTDLLTTILRGEWGFKGMVMTDWGGGHDAVAQMKAGNDLLMPGRADQESAIINAVKNKQLDEAVIDRNVERVLSLVLKSPTFHNYKYSNKPDLKRHAQVAREAATEGMVLLRNQNAVLPLTSTIKKVALFGNSSYDLIPGGTGSGNVNKAYVVSLSSALKNAGYHYDENLYSFYSNYLKEQKAKKPAKASFESKNPVAEEEISLDKIQKAAAENDIALLTIGRNSGEGSDRKLENDYYLSTIEKGLLKKVSDAFHAQGKKMVVLLNIGGVVEVASWRDIPDAILLVWQPGQEGGNAIADVISGRVNPSGKLASSFPVDYNDIPSAKNFPGTVLEGPDPKSKNQNTARAAEVHYEEGIYIGYRYYNSFHVNPAYEFGYGLSYTTFNYSGLKLGSPTFNRNMQATVSVTNTGKVAGKEVVQLYLAAPKGSVDKPASELKGFAKTKLLKPGESQTLTFTLLPKDLASFDPGSSAWIADAGRYTVAISSSSRNPKQTASFSLPSRIVVEKDANVLQPQVPITEIKLPTE
jgi:beta-glucosidase